LLKRMAKSIYAAHPHAQAGVVPRLGTGNHAPL
jgi:hypothetical protein